MHALGRVVSDAFEGLGLRVLLNELCDVHVAAADADNDLIAATDLQEDTLRAEAISAFRLANEDYSQILPRILIDEISQKLVNSIVLLRDVDRMIAQHLDIPIQSFNGFCLLLQLAFQVLDLFMMLLEVDEFILGLGEPLPHTIEVLLKLSLGVISDQKFCLRKLQLLLHTIDLGFENSDLALVGDDVVLQVRVLHVHLLLLALE